MFDELRRGIRDFRALELGHKRSDRRRRWRLVHPIEGHLERRVVPSMPYVGYVGYVGKEIRIEGSSQAEVTNFQNLISSYESSSADPTGYFKSQVSRISQDSTLAEPITIKLSDQPSPNFGDNLEHNTVYMNDIDLLDLKPNNKDAMTQGEAILHILEERWFYNKVFHGRPFTQQHEKDAHELHSNCQIHTEPNYTNHQLMYKPVWLCGNGGKMMVIMCMMTKIRGELTSKLVNINLRSTAIRTPRIRIVGTPFPRPVHTRRPRSHSSQHPVRPRPLRAPPSHRRRIRSALPFRATWSPASYPMRNHPRAGLLSRATFRTVRLMPITIRHRPKPSS